jgi:hypothetical protein
MTDPSTPSSRRGEPPPRRDLADESMDSIMVPVSEQPAAADDPEQKRDGATAPLPPRSVRDRRGGR